MPVRRSRTRRSIAALATSAVAVACLVGTGAPVAHADAVGHAEVFFLPESAGADGARYNGSLADIGPLNVPVGTQGYAGHFSAAKGGDLLAYAPGKGAEIIHDSGTGIDLGAVGVTGTYTPIIGDFDGNGVDDIFWYAPGSAADHLWLFDAVGGHRQLAVNVGGTYRPTVLDANGDGRDDILWYGPGSVADSLWLFGAGAKTHTTKALSIGATYTLVAGRFGHPAAGQPADRLVLYNAKGADYFWTFDKAGNHTSALLPALDGAYQLIPGQFLEEAYGSLYFYAPGSSAEHLWAFGPGAGGDASVEAAPQIGGTYTVHAGDFDGNGLTDLALSSGTKATIWDFEATGPIQQKALTGLPSPSLVQSIGMQG